MTENPGQGVTKCLDCGSQFPVAGARFCPVCGRPLATTQALSSAPPIAPAPAVAPAPPVFGPAQSYGPPQGYEPPQGYPAGYGPEPQRSRGRRTPIVLGLGVVALIVVVVASAALVYSTGGSHATPSPSASAIALASPAASPTAAAISPTVAATPGTVTVATPNSGDSEGGLGAVMTYCGHQTGETVVINTVQYGDNSLDYLKSSTADVVVWSAGSRMRAAAKHGLVAPISDVWQKVGANYSNTLRAASTGDDGQQYFIPLSSEPWVVLYRKSLFAAKGYAVPKTVDQFVTLAKKMKADGLVPLASGDKDGWPAEGMFDILDMRMNGFDFHTGLMAGTEKWTDTRVKAVFQEWAQLLPYFDPNATSRVWQDASQSLFGEKAGMFFFGTFMLGATNDKTVLDDIGLFPFPVFGNQYDSENGIDVPSDGLAITATSQNLGGAKKVLECVASEDAERVYAQGGRGYVPAIKNADTSAFTPFQKEAQQVIESSTRIAQFMDRDSPADFTGATGMQGFLADFMNRPSQDLDAYLAKIQKFWDSLPPE